MDLLKNIKRKRAKQRKKQPLKRDVFNQISGLVRLYGLKESFLSILDNVEDHLSRENVRLSRVRLKAPIEIPLFSLATEEEYYLTMSILSRVDNPYLKFAHSPEEILLCGPLYSLNPSLHSEKLMRYHFETLFLHERARAYRNEPKQDAAAKDES
jgi:hypothetical protein